MHTKDVPGWNPKAHPPRPGQEGKKEHQRTCMRTNHAATQNEEYPGKRLETSRGRKTRLEKRRSRYDRGRKR